MLQAIDIRKKIRRQRNFEGRDRARWTRARSSPSSAAAARARAPSCAASTTFETIDSGEIRIDGQAMVTTGADGAARYRTEKDFAWALPQDGPRLSGLQPLSTLHGAAQHRRAAAAGAPSKPSGKPNRRPCSCWKRSAFADKAGAYPCNLSGGQCQRVAIARALAMDPEILCFDEPTSALDPQLTQEVCVIRQLAAEKRTMIVVTHEMNFARDVADRVIYMENGLVAEDGPAKEVLGSARSAAIRAFAGNVAIEQPFLRPLACFLRKEGLSLRRKFSRIKPAHFSR